MYNMYLGHFLSDRYKLLPIVHFLTEIKDQ